MPTRSSAVISLAAINALKPGDVVHDAKLKGFGARRQKDAISYFLKTRILGRQRWITIGRHGQPWTPDTARRQALKILADPAAAEKPAPPEVTNTFSGVADQFLATHGPKLKPRTFEEYARIVRRYLLPAFDRFPVTDITRADVSAAHASWSKNKRAANHALAVLSKIMSWTEDQGYRPEDSNPCRRVQRYKENKRQTFLTPDELARLGAALDRATAENLVGPFALAAIRLLLLTGARLNEILTLRWSNVDVGRRLIFLDDSKTGKKPLALNDAAIDILNTLPRFDGNPYVIAGHRNGEHLVNLQKPWRTVRKVARLDHVRLHDLRHTFASVAVDIGGSLPVIGRQLGHSQPITTQRYAHLTDSPVHEMAQATGARLAAAMKGVAPSKGD